MYTIHMMIKPVQQRVAEPNGSRTRPYLPALPDLSNRLFSEHAVISAQQAEVVNSDYNELMQAMMQ